MALRTVCILDVGSFKTHCVVANIASDSFEIAGEYKHKTLGFASGYVTNMEQFKKTLYEVIHKTEQISKHVIDKVVLVLYGQYFYSEYASAKLVLNGVAVEQSDVDKLLARANQPSDDSIAVHADIISCAMDDQCEVDDPIGMVGNVLTVKIHIVRCKTMPLKNIYMCLNAINVAVEKLVFGPYATGYAYSMYSESGMFVSVDIGSHTTKIASFERNKMRDQIVLNIGGDAMTNEIATTIRISKSQAERLKILYGAAVSLPADTSENILTVSIDNEPLQIARTKITYTISSRLNEIISLMKKYPLFNTECVIVSGGVSMLPGILEKFYEFFDVTVILPNFKYLAKTMPRKKHKISAQEDVLSSDNLFVSQNAPIIGTIFYLQKKNLNSDESIISTKNKKTAFLKKFLSWISKRF